MIVTENRISFRWKIIHIDISIFSLLIINLSKYLLSIDLFLNQVFVLKEEFTCPLPETLCHRFKWHSCHYGNPIFLSCKSKEDQERKDVNSQADFLQTK